MNKSTRIFILICGSCVFIYALYFASSDFDYKKIKQTVKFETFNQNKQKDQESFTYFYGDLLKERFDQILLNNVKMFNVSPLRIITPKFIENKRGFTVYSGKFSN